MSPSCIDERLPAVLRAVCARFGQAIPERRFASFRTAVLEAYVASGERSLEEYEKRIVGDALESPLVVDLLGRITIKESYFFRDEGVMSTLRDVVLPRLVVRNAVSRRLSVWSAGCANGEEPYSLSILTDQVLPAASGWTVGVVGTDADEGGLRVAARGEYGEWSVRGVPQNIRERCFEARSGRLRLRDRHRRCVRFEAHNLVDEGSLAPAPGTFDLILCRNVAIYLSDEAVAVLYGNLARALDPHGVLITAPSDPAPPKASGLVPALLRSKAHSTLVYTLHPRLWESVSRAPRAAEPSSPPALSAALSVPPPSIAPNAASELRDSLPAAQETAPSDGDAVTPANVGETRASQSTVAGAELDPSSYFTRALLDIDAHRHDEAEAHLRKVLYLSPSFAEAHYRLGLLLARRGELVAARRSLLTALRVMRSEEQSSPAWAASIGAQLARMERKR